MRVDCDRMMMTREVYEQIENTIGRHIPECGGVLGTGEDGVIEAYWFDSLGKSSSSGYAPDVESINRVLEETWMPRGIYMTGMIHSHENGIAVPSCGDIAYGVRILEALDTVEAFGTIKAQTLSNQIGVVLVFIIMRWIRPDEVAFRVMHPEIKVSAAHLVIMIRLSRLEMQKHLPSNEPK